MGKMTHLRVALLNSKLKGVDQHKIYIHGTAQDYVLEVLLP